MYAEDDSEPRAGPSSYHDPSPTMSSTVKELDIEIEVELYISKATTITRKVRAVSVNLFPCSPLMRARSWFLRGLERSRRSVTR